MNNFGIAIGILCGFMIHKSIGQYSEGKWEWECDGKVADFVNRRINEMLSEFTIKPDNDLCLTEAYNLRYKRLSKVFIKKPSKRLQCELAEFIMEQFAEIALSYDDVAPQMEQAMEELSDIQENSENSLNLKADALRVMMLIKFSDSISLAEDALQKYEDFKQEHNMTSGDKSDTESEFLYFLQKRL